MVFTDNPATDPFIYIIALKGHLENTVSLHMHAVNLRISAWTA
jgi:hypothetical protein